MKSTKTSTQETSETIFEKIFNTHGFDENIYNPTELFNIYVPGFY